MIDPESIEALKAKRTGFGIIIGVAVLLCAGCAGNSPIAPSSTGFSWLTPSAPLPTTNPQFDQSFYNALAHGTLEMGTSTPLHRLMQSPSIYLQRAGLSDAFVAQIEQTYREEIPAFTGGALTLARFEAGETTRAEAGGWIVIELRNDGAADCGSTKLGASAGHIWINTAAKCQRDGSLYLSIFAHELGHALGFYHVDSGLMQPYVTKDQQLTDREQLHGAVAYTQALGSH